MKDKDVFVNIFKTERLAVYDVQRFALWLEDFYISFDDSEIVTDFMTTRFLDSIKWSRGSILFCG